MPGADAVGLRAIELTDPELVGELLLGDKWLRADPPLPKDAEFVFGFTSQDGRRVFLVFAHSSFPVLVLGSGIYTERMRWRWHDP